MRALPGLPPGLVAVRRALMLETLIHALADAEVLAHADSSRRAGLQPRAFVDALIDFIAGGLAAPAQPASAGEPS